MLSAIRRVGIAEPNAGTDLAEREVRCRADRCIRIGRRGDDVDRGAEVVRHDPFVPVALFVTEVLIDDLANAQPVRARRLHDDLFGVDPFVVTAGADQAGQAEHRTPRGGTADQRVPPPTHPPQHGDQSACGS